MEILHKAFNGFNSASETLVQYYKVLEERVKLLTGEVEEKKQLLDSIMNSIDVGVIFFDEGGVIRVVNRVALAMLNVREEEILGKQRIPASIQDEYILPEKGKPFYAIVSEGAVRDGNGGTSGRVMIFNDVTKVRKLEIENERNRRLSAMGEFVLKTAHEIRNPLGSIELFANLLSKDLQSTKHEEYARRISGSIRLLTNTLDNMLRFTGKIEPNLEFCYLNDFIKEIEEEFGELFSSRGIIFSFREEESCWMLMDKVLMRQAMINLLINSVQAMPEGGDIIMRVEYRDEASKVVVTQRDSGQGMDDETIRRIFEPFFSTKDRGTGLGMSIVQAIISAHGGEIIVESHVDAGSVFALILPVYGKKSEREAVRDGVSV